MKKFIPLFVFFLFLSGCGVSFLGPAASIVGQAYIKWNEGEAHKYYNLDSETMYRATKRTANEFGYVVSRDDPPQNGNFYLVVGSNDRFKINIKKIEKNITLVSIRINFMGDKPYAELFYKNLDEETSVIEYDRWGRPRKLNEVKKWH
jgi:hypothetical protein